jgi:hypothetical protein
MMKRTMLTTIIVITVSSTIGSVQAVELSIYDIQYTDDPNGESSQNGIIIDCTGGIVTHKSPSGRPRLIVQDPAYPDGWGAIQVKDLSDTGVFSDVNVGDWISLINVLVEEFKGSTFLQYTEENNAGFTITSRNNPLPRPLVVTVDQIAAPIEGLDSWLVSDYSAEKYEAVLIKVVDVTVGDLGQGKAYDNYQLMSNADPNLSCWVSDYLNTDKQKGLIYHPYTETGQQLCGITGVLEQYTGDSEGIYYDYYQLLTRNAEDFVVDQIADLDGDCDVDFDDFNILAGHWREAECTEPDGCGGVNLVEDQLEQEVNMFDLLKFTQYWLEGK